jgi:1,4-alpha-glucan branching enzyme
MNYFDSNHGKHIFEFSFPWSGPIYLVGDFNDWHASSTFEMQKSGARWKIEIILPTGRYRYGFEIRGCIFEDPHAHLLSRNLGWPRSCAVCQMKHYCKTTDKKSKASRAS